MAEHDDRNFNGWPEYRRLVLTELERLSRQFDAHDKKVEDLNQSINLQLQAIRQEIAVLKVKSGVWGATAGLLAVLTTIGIQYLLRA